VDITSISLEEISKRLNVLSWDILRMLNKTEYLRYSEIKTKLKVSQDKASMEIARLEGACLIESQRDEVDKRILKFKITDYGISILNMAN